METRRCDSDSSPIFSVDLPGAVFDKLQSCKPSPSSDVIPAVSRGASSDVFRKSKLSDHGEERTYSQQYHILHLAKFFARYSFLDCVVPISLTIQAVNSSSRYNFSTSVRFPSSFTKILALSKIEEVSANSARRRSSRLPSPRLRATMSETCRCDNFSLLQVFKIRCSSAPLALSCFFCLRD